MDERIFLLSEKSPFETRVVGDKEVVLNNPFYPSDKAIIISGEKFKKVMGVTIDTILDKELKQLNDEVKRLESK